MSQLQTHRNLLSLVRATVDIGYITGVVHEKSMHEFQDAFMESNIEFSPMNWESTGWESMVRSSLESRSNQEVDRCHLICSRIRVGLYHRISLTLA